MNDSKRKTEPRDKWPYWQLVSSWKQGQKLGKLPVGQTMFMDENNHYNKDVNSLQLILKFNKINFKFH